MIIIELNHFYVINYELILLFSFDITSR